MSSIYILLTVCSVHSIAVGQKSSCKKCNHDKVDVIIIKVKLGFDIFQLVSNSKSGTLITVHSDCLGLDNLISLQS